MSPLQEFGIGAPGKHRSRKEPGRFAWLGSIGGGGEIRTRIAVTGAGPSSTLRLQPKRNSRGLSNVAERLRVLYGASGRVVLRGSPGKGACARVEIPWTESEGRLTA